MTRDEVVAKARDLMTPVLGASNTLKTHRQGLRPGKNEGHPRASPSAPKIVRCGWGYNRKRRQWICVLIANREKIHETDFDEPHWRRSFDQEKR